MLRHILRDLEWAILLREPAKLTAFVIITLIMFLIIANLTITPAIATITETDIAPGQIHCRSEQVLKDETGHKWQVMLFTQVNSSQVASLNLRLSGLSSSVSIQPQKPLVINISGERFAPHHRDRYEATNIFLGKSPLPSIGQYDLKNIVQQLPTEELLLELPLENGKSTRLHIPQAVVKEWQEVASKIPGKSQKLPSGFQLAC